MLRAGYPGQGAVGWPYVRLSRPRPCMGASDRRTVLPACSFTVSSRKTRIVQTQTPSRGTIAARPTKPFCDRVVGQPGMPACAAHLTPWRRRPLDRTRATGHRIRSSCISDLTSAAPPTSLLISWRGTSERCAKDQVAWSTPPPVPVSPTAADASAAATWVVTGNGREIGIADRRDG
jgi:hypothetical protein